MMSYYHVRLPALRVDTFVNAPPEILLRLALPGVDRESRLRERSSHLIL